MLNIPYEVQQALRKGDMRKNYKMKVNDVDPDTGERTYLYTIDNNSLVSESVKIDERMVTGKVLKFGLCEGSSLEFQYFDHPNINGKDVQVYCSVEYVDGNGDVAWYDIPMGWYSVDQCPMQWDTGIYKVTAYNKLKSNYLDAKANTQIEEVTDAGIIGRTGSASLSTILDGLLDGYSIERGYTDIPFIQSDNFGVPYAKYYANAKAYGFLYSSIYLTIDSFNLTDIYRLKLNCKKIYEKILSYIPQEYLDKTVEEIIYVDNEWKLYFSGNFLDKISGDDAYPLNIQAEIYVPNYPVFTYQINGTNREQEELLSEWMTNISTRYRNARVFLRNVPIAWKSINWYPDLGTDPDVDWTTAELNEGLNRLAEIYTNIEYMSFQKQETSAMESVIYTDNDVAAWPDVTLRELQSAVYETVCQYGQLDRETDLFTGVELNQGGLYPADTLYPDNTLYPQGNMEHPFPSTYSKLWTDTVGEQSFRYLIITYKAMENGQEVEKTLQRTVNADGTTNYNMSDNWLFRNLIWTAADVGDYADAMVLKMKDIRWFPFEMWCAGLPYVETGDAIEITDKQGNTHTSYVLTRTLDGIHNLQDTFINGELDIF